MKAKAPNKIEPRPLPYWRYRHSGLPELSARHVKNAVKLLLLSCLASKMSFALAASSGFIWTGGTCCGQSQPQFIHDPAALVNYFQTAPPPNTYPGAYTTCLAPPTAIAQSCFVYAWYTSIPYSSEGSCPVSGLTPLTDPVAIDFENGNRWRPDLLTTGPTGYQTKLACVQNGITSRGGTYVGTSAYRPTQYQQHLFEIVDNNFRLSRPGYMTAHPECQARRDEITRAMGSQPGHALKRKQKVAKPGTSRHESGTAFDLTPSGLTDAQLAPVYAGCGVSHTAVPGEPWHVQ